MRIDTHRHYSEARRRLDSVALDHLAPRPGDLVLDVGCGTGGFHAELVRRGVRGVLGVDTSRAMVDSTQRQANAAGWPVMALWANAETLPLPDAAYDCAMANHVLFYCR